MPSADYDALVALLGEHRCTDKRDENNLPMCGCGRSLGWHETWPEHLAGVLLGRAIPPEGSDKDCTATGFSGEGRCIEPAVRDGLCAEHLAYENRTEKKEK